MPYFIYYYVTVREVIPFSFARISQTRLASPSAVIILLTEATAPLPLSVMENGDFTRSHTEFGFLDGQEI